MAKFIQLVLLILFINATSCIHNNSKSNFNKLLADRLDSILESDQRYRQMLSRVEYKYGLKSQARNDLISKIKKQDSINLSQVTSILDKYGWVGVDEVGGDGNSSIFLVIQHADLKTQEKYLPIMRAAVTDGKALARDLAFLEDRIAIRHGRNQIYGTQLYRNENGQYYFAPIADEKNVNNRRREVGLGHLEDRAKEFNFEYKLPTE